MRLIDADALEKEWCSGCEHEKNKYANCDDCALAHAPTVEPERKKGKWVDLQCNQCGQVDMSKPNFCPGCGSDMRGDQDDND